MWRQVGRRLIRNAHHRIIISTDTLSAIHPYFNIYLRHIASKCRRSDPFMRKASRSVIPEGVSVVHVCVCFFHTSRCKHRLFVATRSPSNPQNPPVVTCTQITRIGAVPVQTNASRSHIRALPLPLTRSLAHTVHIYLMIGIACGTRAPCA